MQPEGGREGGRKGEREWCTCQQCECGTVECSILTFQVDVQVLQVRGHTVTHLKVCTTNIELKLTVSSPKIIPH